ncbi:MAG: hypothetical protein R2867_32780 [Caldilineaceae bacterium]
MIYLQITAKVFPQKMAELQGVLQEVVVYMCKETPEVTYDLIRNINGNAGYIHTLATYHSMADWEAARAKRATDAKWQTILTKLRELVDLGNAETNFYELIARSENK